MDPDSESGQDLGPTQGRSPPLLRPGHLCWKKLSRARQTPYRSGGVSRRSSCWLKVLPCTRMLVGRMSATHCRELSAADGLGGSKESESAGSQAGEAQVTRCPQAQGPPDWVWLWAPCIGRHICGRSWGWRERRAGSLRRSHWVPQHQAGDAAGLGDKQRGPPQGLCGGGVSPLGNGTSPSSTTSVGIAPLPCSMDTTLSWEQFLPSRDGPGGPGQVSPVHGRPLDTARPPGSCLQRPHSKSPAGPEPEPGHSLSCQLISAGPAPGHRRAGTRAPPPAPRQGSPYRARLSTLCPAWGWVFAGWKDELMSWRGRENRFRSSPRVRDRPWGPTGQRRSGPGLGVPRGSSFGGQFSAKALVSPAASDLMSSPLRKRIRSPDLRAALSAGLPGGKKRGPAGQRGGAGRACLPGEN